MREQYVQVLLRSAIGKALGYSIERWERLSRYTQNGMLNIDSNPVENSIRPVALGRKNYLFAGSHEAAKRSGMLYSYSVLAKCTASSLTPGLKISCNASPIILSTKFRSCFRINIKNS